MLAMVVAPKENLLIQLPWPMLVGIGQCGALGCRIHAEVLELSQAGRQSSTDLSQRLCLTQLAEQHRHELSPATESFYTFLGSCLSYRSYKILMRKYL